MKKRTVRKPAGRSVSRKRPKKKSYKKAIVAVGILLFLVAGIYHYRTGLKYYFGFKSHKIVTSEHRKELSDVRNVTLLAKYPDYVAGIDVSQYQSKIDWEIVEYIEGNYPINFVFVRATAGTNRKDVTFKRNWKSAKKKGFVRGAYHYYRPNENSLTQARNFIATVKLEKGDLPPVLDIERLPKNQSMDSLKVGLRRWLEAVDKHYGIQPIIYSGQRYYDDFLRKDFPEYTFWIANYNFFVEEMDESWLFWQFTQSATVKGIQGNVDVNIYGGTRKQLEYLTINR